MSRQRLEETAAEALVPPDGVSRESSQMRLASSATPKSTSGERSPRCTPRASAS